MVTQVEADSLLVEWQYFMLQLSSFQTNQTVRKCILLFLLYILTGDPSLNFIIFKIPNE